MALPATPQLAKISCGNVTKQLQDSTRGRVCTTQVKQLLKGILLVSHNWCRLITGKMVRLSPEISQWHEFTRAAGTGKVLVWAHRGRDPEQARPDASRGMVLEGDVVGYVLLYAPEGFMDVVIDALDFQGSRRMARLGCEAYIGSGSRLIAQADHKCPAARQRKLSAAHRSLRTFTSPTEPQSLCC